VSVVCKQIGITDQTYFRWRKEYGGLKVDQAKRFKVLEQDCTSTLPMELVLGEPFRATFYFIFSVIIWNGE
jgi:hypothetical protein